MKNNIIIGKIGEFRPTANLISVNARLYHAFHEERSKSIVEMTGKCLQRFFFEWLLKALDIFTIFTINATYQ